MSRAGIAGALVLLSGFYLGQALRRGCVKVQWSKIDWRGRVGSAGRAGSAGGRVARVAPRAQDLGQRAGCTGPAGGVRAAVEP